MSWLISSTDRCRAFVYNFGKLNSELVDFAAAKLSLSFDFQNRKKWRWIQQIKTNWQKYIKVSYSNSLFCNKIETLIDGARQK